MITEGEKKKGSMLRDESRRNLGLVLLSFRVWFWLWGKILPVPRLIFKVMLSFISDSAPYINALALLKAVRAEPLVLNSEWGVLLTDLHMSFAVLICREHFHTALLAWLGAELCSRVQHWAGKAQIFSAIGEVREMWLKIWFQCLLHGRKLWNADVLESQAN